MNKIVTGALQHSRKRQNGAVMAIALVLLLVLTVLAASSMKLATTQERISGNTRDQVLAFQAAEAGLRAGEEAMEAAALLNFNGNRGRYEICAPGDNRVACNKPDYRKRDSTGWEVAEGAVDGVNRPPEYIIEKYNRSQGKDSSLDSDIPLEKVDFYRITSRGFGKTDKSMVVLQTTYRRN